jgi:hypothetical protein
VDAAQKEELTRLVDGRLVTRSWLFVQKQYELMREGRDEREAYQLAEQAVLEEERNALERVRGVPLVCVCRVSVVRRMRLTSKVLASCRGS